MNHIQNPTTYSSKYLILFSIAKGQVSKKSNKAGARKSAGGAKKSKNIKKAPAAAQSNGGAPKSKTPRRKAAGAKKGGAKKGGKRSAKK